MSKTTRRKRLRSKLHITDFLNVVYDKLVNRVNGYGHAKYKGMELITRVEFISWAMGQGRLFVLYHEWSKQGYTHKTRPSVDRIDVDKGYTLDNIRWLTVSENSRLNWQKVRATA